MPADVLDAAQKRLRTVADVITSLGVIVGVFGVKLLLPRYTIPYAIAALVAGACYYVFRATDTQGKPRFASLHRKYAASVGIITVIAAVTLLAWTLYVKIIAGYIEQKQSKVAFDTYRAAEASIIVVEPNVITGARVAPSKTRALRDALRGVAAIESTASASPESLSKQLNIGLPAGYLVDVTPISSPNFIGNIIRLREHVDTMTAEPHSHDCFGTNLRRCYIAISEDTAQEEERRRYDSDGFFATVEPRLPNPFMFNRPVVLSPSDFVNTLEKHDYLTDEVSITWFYLATMQEWRNGFAVTLATNSMWQGGNVAFTSVYVTRVSLPFGSRLSVRFPLEDWQGQTTITADSISGSERYFPDSIDPEFAKLIDIHFCWGCIQLSQGFVALWDTEEGQYKLSEAGYSREPVDWVLRAVHTLKNQDKFEMLVHESSDAATLQSDFRTCHIRYLGHQQGSATAYVVFTCSLGNLTREDRVDLAQLADGTWDFAGFHPGDSPGGH